MVFHPVRCVFPLKARNASQEVHAWKRAMFLPVSTSLNTQNLSNMSPVNSHGGAVCSVFLHLCGVWYIVLCLRICQSTVACVRHMSRTISKRVSMFLWDAACLQLYRCSLSGVHDPVSALCGRIGLWNLDGWAVFQATAEGEHHVKSHEYLYDVIASWEM